MKIEVTKDEVYSLLQSIISQRISLMQFYYESERNDLTASYEDEIARLQKLDVKLTSALEAPFD